MKAILFIILFILVINITNPAFAANDKDTLTKIENNIYGYDYSTDNNQNRIKRLEKTVYGRTLSGDISTRINKLSADISADVMGLEIPAVKDTFLAQENEIEDRTVNYPIVDEIEQKIFGKTNKNLDFHSRIVKIEKKIFGKIYDVDDYQKRLDRIKTKILPESIAKEEIEYDYSELYQNDKILNSMNLGGTDSNRYRMPFGQRNYTRPYKNYGNYTDFSSIDNSISADRDNLSDNLTQMEYDMFGTEFSGEDVQSRVKRLNSVNKARKSTHKYDSQKFSQHMSTAMEIGAMILMILAMVL